MRVQACFFNHESSLRPDRFVTQKIVKAVCRISAGTQDVLALGNISIQRDWGRAPEYVEAMWQMLQREHADDFVIATGQTFSLQEFIEEVFGRFDMDWQKHVVCNSELMRPTDIQISLANPEKAERQLGWKAKYTMPDVVKMMIDAELGAGALH